MKKMFISVIALAMGVTAMATETAYVQIKMTGASGGTSKLFITEDDAHTSAFESGVDTERLMSLANSKSVLLYGYQGTTPCEDVVTNDLTNLKIGFTTNTLDQDYTFTFIDKSGGTITLFDKKTGTTTDLSTATKYDFSVAAEFVGQKQILDRFVINYVPAPSTDFEVCFINNHLTVSNNPWSDGKIAVYDGETKVVEKDGTETDIDLTALEAGKRYMVKFFPTSDLSGEPKRQLVIVP
jgi:hypothetical protein